MILRQAYIKVTSYIIENEVKRRIECLQINLGHDHPEYQKKYEAIVKDYELRVQELISLSK